jgi:truncated hemoglobin YjbI
MNKALSELDMHDQLRSELQSALQGLANHMINQETLVNISDS